MLTRGGAQRSVLDPFLRPEEPLLELALWDAPDDLPPFDDALRLLLSSMDELRDGEPRLLPDWLPLLAMTTSK